MEEQTKVSELGTLVKSRGYVKAAITRAKKFVEEKLALLGSEASEVNVSAIRLRRERLISAFEEYSRLCHQIQILDENDSEDLGIVEDLYFELVAQMNVIIDKSSAISNNPLPTSHSISTDKASHNIKLPHINIPTFSGKYSDFYAFFNMFDSVVGSTDKPPVQKLYYLKTFLSGEALALVNNLPLTDDSYVEAVNLLKQRYDNKFQIINEHINMLMDQQSIAKSVPTALRTFVSTCQQHMAALKNMGEPVTQWDSILICLLSKKLDILSSRAFQLERAQATQPTMNDFLSFLERRALALENTDSISASKPQTQTQRYAANVVSTSNAKETPSCIYYCLHLQLYRDPKDRFKKGQTKASLSLQHFLGFESGFTLDKESNTIAIICQDVTVVLAFETRERLISWQVKVGTQLGSSKEFLVMIGGSNKKLPAGPARLHLQGRRFALTSGVPPRLLGLWELAHLRRYGVVEGRFCFEGGSHCGKGEGLHLLITDQAQEITDAFDSAARGDSLQRTPRKSTDKGNKSRPSTRLSDFNAVDASMPDTASALYEQNFFGEDCGETSPYWPSDERRYDEHEYRAHDEIGAKPPWSGADHVTLERCNNCLTKLGTMSQTSTVALDTGSQFNPAWTMDPVPESNSDNSSNSTEYLTPRAIRRTLEACQCKDKPPDRPPKPAHFDQKKPPAPLPVQGCTCGNDNHPVNNPKVGPYENYDVPKIAHTELDNKYYDTPKRLKQALADDLFQVTKPSAPGSLVLKKNCGCILKFASRKKPVIVECDDSIQPVECPCQKVTNWANNLISLPYCKRINENINTEIFTGQKPDDMAIYATVDVSRKTNRQSAATDKDNTPEYETQFMNYQNIEPKDKEFEGPYANYENLEFALSLEYYENAKDLLKKAGVTQTELDALSANVEYAATTLPKKVKHCSKCVHPEPQECRKNKQDEYLLMEPAKQAKPDTGQMTGTTTGYTPMSPNPNWSQSLRHPINKVHRADIEKSLSIPALIGSNLPTYMSGNNNKEAMQKRSSSVDSARLLEDLKEFDSSIGSHATSSSLETLRNLALENRRSSSPCDNDRGCYDCCKSSGSENKTSESSSKDAPPLRNKHMDNAQIKRSSSVPCKSGGNRDSSSSNDSGVSSCSLKHGGPEFTEFEMPLTSGSSKYQYMLHKKMRGSLAGFAHSSLPRKSKSSDPLRDMSMQIHKAHVHAKSSSAEAEVPVLPPKQFKGVMDTHSTSSGTSDMSDYIETLSLTSSHSSSDAPSAIRLSRQPTNTLRPRSGKEYHNMDPIITSMYKNGKELCNYTNIP